MKKSILFILSTLLLTVLLFIQCEKDETPVIEEPIEEKPLIIQETKSESINASTGGVVELSSGVIIEIPSNVLTTDKTISVETIDPFLVENDIKIDDDLNGLKISAVIRCEPSGITFNSPVKIIIPFYEQLLPDDLPIDSIEVISFSNNQIESIPFTIDRIKKVIIAETTHFSDFTIKVKSGKWEITEKPKLGLNASNNNLTLSFKAQRDVNFIKYALKWFKEETSSILYQEVYYNIRVYRKKTWGGEFIGGRQIYKSWLKTQNWGKAYKIQKGSKANDRGIYSYNDFPSKDNVAEIFEKVAGGSSNITTGATNSVFFDENKEITGSIEYNDLGSNIPDDFLPSFTSDGNTNNVDIINRDKLEEGEKYFLKIAIKGKGDIVNDTWLNGGMGKFESSTFTYSDVNQVLEWNVKPVISNVKPSNNSTYKFRENFTLSCSVNDNEDGRLTGSSVKWEWHTVNGEIYELGTGTSLESTNFKKELGIGLQTIYVIATDATGASTQVSFKINIVNNPPEVSISSPANSSSFELDDEISFIGKITDVEDETNINLDGVKWKSDKEGEFKEGDLNFKYSNLKIGTHEITLEYTDYNNEKSTAKSVITIGVKKPEVVFTDGEWLIWESNNSVTLKGKVTDNGGGDIKDRGFVLSTKTAEPTLTNNDGKISGGSGDGFYSATIKNLEYDKPYFVRAYADNGKVAYSSVFKDFVTKKKKGKPTVTTTAPINITATSATLGGNVSSDGNAEVTERGVYYGTSQNPESTGTKVKIGNGTGSFSEELTELDTDKTYYIKAYAINSEGASYGEEKQFSTTTEKSKPTVTTLTPTNITSSSAIVGGNITSNGNAEITERGIYYGTSQNPESTGTKVKIGSGTGSFS